MNNWQFTVHDQDNENIIKFDSKINSIYNKIISQRIYKESIPDWLDELGVKEIGEEKWGIEIKALNNPAELCIRVNTIKTSKAKLKKDFEKKGMIFSGLSPDNKLPEIIELENHPWFIGVQFHPEFKSRPLSPHPLFSSFIKAAKINTRK